MSRGINLIDLYKLSLEQKQSENNTSDNLRQKIVEEIHFIVNNRGLDLINYLRDKNIQFEKLDSELHMELSKKYPYEYSDALIKSGLKSIGWLSQYGYVIRNIINGLKGIIEKKEYDEIIESIFTGIPNLKEIPLIDLNLFKEHFGDNKLNYLIKNRPLEEIQYIKNNLMKYDSI